MATKRTVSRRGMMVIGCVVLATAGVAAANSRARSNRAAPSQLAQLVRQHDQLVGQYMQPCMAQMNQAMAQTAMAAANGMMADYNPPCAAYMAGWTTQLAVLEAQIYRLQTGANVGPADFAIVGGAPGAAPLSGDAALSAAERYDRNAIRGTSSYADADGAIHELPTAPSYFRDRTTGDYVPSPNGYAPSDGRDYEPLQNRD